MGGGRYWNWFGGSEDLNEMGRKSRRVIEAWRCACVGKFLPPVRDADSSSSPNGIRNTMELQGIPAIVFHLTYIPLNLHLEVVSLPQR